MKSPRTKKEMKSPTGDGCGKENLLLPHSQLQARLVALETEAVLCRGLETRVLALEQQLDSVDYLKTEIGSVHAQLKLLLSSAPHTKDNMEANASELAAEVSNSLFNARKGNRQLAVSNDRSNAACKAERLVKKPVNSTTAQRPATSQDRGSASLPSRLQHSDSRSLPSSSLPIDKHRSPSPPLRPKLTPVVSCNEVGTEPIKKLLERPVEKQSRFAAGYKYPTAEPRKTRLLPDPKVPVAVPFNAQVGQLLPLQGSAHVGIGADSESKKLLSGTQKTLNNVSDLDSSKPGGSRQKASNKRRCKIPDAQTLHESKAKRSLNVVSQDLAPGKSVMDASRVMDAPAQPQVGPAWTAQQTKPECDEDPFLAELESDLKSDDDPFLGELESDLMGLQIKLEDATATNVQVAKPIEEAQGDAEPVPQKTENVNSSSTAHPLMQRPAVEQTEVPEESYEEKRWLWYQENQVIDQGKRKFTTEQADFGQQIPSSKKKKLEQCESRHRKKSEWYQKMYSAPQHQHALQLQNFMSHKPSFDRDGAHPNSGSAKVTGWEKETPEIFCHLPGRKVFANGAKLINFSTIASADAVLRNIREGSIVQSFLK